MTVEASIVESVHIVCKSLDVFLVNLLRLMPERDVNFAIEVE